MKARRVLIATLLAAAMPAMAETRDLFERLGGTWTGGGSVIAAGGSAQPIRCRAAYAPTAAAGLHLDIACATDSFKLRILSDLARDGERLSGAWHEATYGVSGTVSGSLHGDRLDAAVAGLGVTAHLALALHGTSQSVTLASSGPVAGTAAVTLHRR